MTMSDTREIINRYFTAFAQKDLTTMRTLIHDDVSFQGPLATLDNADDYMHGMAQMTANLTRLERRMLWLSGNDACQVYDLILTAPTVTMPVAAWITVRGDRIAAVRVFSDVRPLVQPPAA